MNDEMPDIVERRKTAATKWTERREWSVVIGAALIILGVSLCDFRAGVILAGLLVCGSGLIGLIWGK